MFPNRWAYLIFTSIVSVLGGLLLSVDAAAQSCPIPGIGETVIELCHEGQTEIPRGTCLEICIRGKMKNETMSLSIDETYGQGFHFNQDNGPKTWTTNDTKIWICSDSTSCGSSSIILTENGSSKVIGSVRSDSGGWKFISRLATCPFSGPATSRTQAWSTFYEELIVGNQKIYEDKSNLHRCSLLVGGNCQCGLCYDQLTCITDVPCPIGFTRKSPQCCERIYFDGPYEIITVICTKMGNGPWLYEWRCN